jgi:hypothetical protein
MKFTDPIYDRTSTDITNRTAKAFINIVDWVRINGNTEILHALIESLMSIGVDFTTLPTPTITTFPTVAQINSLITNIENIRINSGLPSALGIVELFDEWSAGMWGQTPGYEDVNDWERDLYIIFNNLAASVEYTIYCGVATVGQTRFYQHRWRQYSWVPDSASPVRRPRTNNAICGSGIMRQNGFRRY